MRGFILKGIIFGGILVVLLGVKFVIELRNYDVLNDLKVALASNTEVLVFGSSVNEHAAESEDDKRFISQIINDLSTDKKVVGISHPAYHAEMYYALIKYINQNASYKPILVIPINLRYFSPEWDLRPSYEFVKERNLLDKNIFWNFYSPYEENSVNTFTHTPVYFRDEKIGIVNDFIRRSPNSISELENGFILNYMQPITPAHRKLKALKEIEKLAEENQFKVLFYITPIDFERANGLKIEYFNEEVNSNLAMIKSTLKSEHLLDLSFDLGHDKFDYEEKPNEHLNIKGRLQVAKLVSNILEKM